MRSKQEIQDKLAYWEAIEREESSHLTGGMPTQKEIAKLSECSDIINTLQWVLEESEEKAPQRPVYVNSRGAEQEGYKVVEVDQKSIERYPKVVGKNN